MKNILNKVMNILLKFIGFSVIIIGLMSEQPLELTMNKWLVIISGIWLMCGTISFGSNVVIKDKKKNS